MDYLQTRELYHYGIKGQKWGVRRYTNEDGTLTQEGQTRYNEILKNNKDMDMYNKIAGDSSNRYWDYMDSGKLDETPKAFNKARKLEDKMNADREKYQSEYKKLESEYASIQKKNRFRGNVL